MATQRRHQESRPTNTVQCLLIWAAMRKRACAALVAICRDDTWVRAHHLDRLVQAAGTSQAVDGNAGVANRIEPHVHDCAHGETWQQPPDHLS